jgi:hypothetical protein
LVFFFFETETELDTTNTERSQKEKNREKRRGGYCLSESSLIEIVALQKKGIVAKAGNNRHRIRAARGNNGRKKKKKKEVGIFQKGKKRNSEKSPSTKALTLLLLACFEDWEQFIKRGARNKRHYKRKKEKN